MTQPPADSRSRRASAWSGSAGSVSSWMRTRAHPSVERTQSTCAAVAGDNNLLSARTRGRRAFLERRFVMSSRELPARPSLDHLKHEAKALHNAFTEGDADARRRVLDAIGETTPLKLTDAQRVIAREYGFPTWAELRERVQATAGVDEAIAEFLAAVQQQNRDGAARVLRAQPRVGHESL